MPAVGMSAMKNGYQRKCIYVYICVYVCVCVFSSAMKRGVRRNGFQFSCLEPKKPLKCTFIEAFSNTR